MDVFAAVVVEPDGATHIVPVWAETRAQAGELACAQVGRGGHTDSLGEDVLVLVFAAGEIQELHECAQDMVQLVRPHLVRSPPVRPGEADRKAGPDQETERSQENEHQQKVILERNAGGRAPSDGDPESSAGTDPISRAAQSGTEADPSADAEPTRLLASEPGTEFGRTAVAPPEEPGPTHTDGADDRTGQARGDRDGSSAERKAPKRPTRPRKTAGSAPKDSPLMANLIPERPDPDVPATAPRSNGFSDGKKQPSQEHGAWLTTQRDNLIPHASQLDEMGFLELLLYPEGDDDRGRPTATAPPSWDDVGLPIDESRAADVPDWCDPGVAAPWRDGEG